MKTNAKRLMSLLLAMCMLLCTAPMVFADGEGETKTTLVETIPNENVASGKSAMKKDNIPQPRDYVILRFSAAMSDAAKQPSSYKITGGTKDVTINSVTDLGNNAYKLNLAASTVEAGVKYTVSFPDLKDANGGDLAKTSFSFYSMLMLYDWDWSGPTGDGRYEDCMNASVQRWIYLTSGDITRDDEADESPISSAIRAKFLGTDYGNEYNYANRFILSNGDWCPADIIEPNTSYVISFRYKTESPSATASIVPASNHWVDSKCNVAPLNSTNWQNYTGVFTTDAGTAGGGKSNGSLTLAVYNSTRTAEGSMLGKNIWIDDVRVFKKPTYTVDTANSYPSDAEVVMPTDTIKVKYTGPMSEAALNKDNYTISGVTTEGAEAPISITSVKELSGNVYELKLSAETANMAKYTVSTKNMTDFLGSAVADANIRFISGEKILRENHFNKGEPTIGDPSSVVRSFYATPTTRTISDEDATGVEESKSVKATITGEPGQGVSGPYYYRLYPFGDKDRSNGNWIDDYNFTVGQKYRIKFSYKADENLDYTVSLYHGEKVFQSKYPTFKFTKEWQTYDEVITADFADNMHLYLSNNFINKPVYLDDIKLSQPMTKPTTAATVTDKATGALGTNEVTLTFSEQMDAISVANKANYVLKKGEDVVEGGIKSAVYNSTDKKVVVTLDKIEPNADYTLEYKGLEDFYFNKVENGNHNVRFTADVKVYGDVKLYSADTELTALGDTAAEVTAKFDGVMNYSGKDVNVKLIVAYFENGVLKGVKTSDAEVKNNQVLTDAISAKVNAGAKADGVTRAVKAFVFNGSTLAPLNGGASADEPVATPGE